MMTLGPLHKKIQAHIKCIINDPDFLIGDKGSCEFGTLTGEMWESVAIFEKIQSIKSTMPHLRPLIIWFHKGALEAWKQFTLPATNYVGEGALGLFRVLL
jgi:hypothetical protein